MTVRPRLVVPLVALLAGLLAAPSHAGITIVNMDGAGEGFNDPTPAAPVGGNPGTTIGQQRLNRFHFIRRKRLEADDALGWGCGGR